MHHSCPQLKKKKKKILPAALHLKPEVIIVQKKIYLNQEKNKNSTNRTIKQIVLRS